MAENNGNGNNGNGARFSMAQIIGGSFSLLTVFMGLLYAYTSSAHEAIFQLQAGKLDKTEFKECRIDLTVNQNAMESRIMARLDKIDLLIESQSKERLAELKEQLRKIGN